MKRYKILRLHEHVPEHPERTAYRDTGFFNFEAQVWPNRESMARSIRMQEKRERRPTDWRPFVKLRDGEGY